MSEWRPIETAPRDGTWFLIVDASRARITGREVGRYCPMILDRFVDAGDGLYRRETYIAHEWEGFDNFHRATHWMPFPEPPAHVCGEGER